MTTAEILLKTAVEERRSARDLEIKAQSAKRCGDHVGAQRFHDYAALCYAQAEESELCARVQAEAYPNSGACHV